MEGRDVFPIRGALTALGLGYARGHTLGMDAWHFVLIRWRDGIECMCRSGILIRHVPESGWVDATLLGLVEADVDGWFTG